ncbi:MAG: hypothetical protein HY652_00005, partial [Acidobacteria bacterium]|nr:hypothetical protein [Acidobacteriota bacterium]
KGNLLTDHGLTTNATSGKIDFAIVSTALSSFKSGAGSVAVVTFQVNPSSSATTTTLSLSNITAATASGAAFPVTGKNGTLRISAAQCLGGANGDKTRDVLDVVKILRHIVGLELLTAPTLAQADVNRDGAVNVLDVVRLLNHIVRTDPLPECR